jgi:ubiquitin
MSAHENLEHAEHAEHASHSGNKKIALLISVLALFLAFSETLGKSAQTTAITLNVTSNDLWAFFQAKTIRMAVLSTASEQMQIEADRATEPALKDRLSKTIDGWKKNVARYDDDAKSNEGRKQLSARAKAAEHQRDEALARYHNYEFASAAFQIGIVLASAQVITGMAVLGWLSGLLGVAGLMFTAFGLWLPHALDFLMHAGGGH